MITYIKSFLIKVLPFKYLNLLRALRGGFQLTFASYCPNCLLNQKYKSIKLKSTGLLIDGTHGHWGSAFREYSVGKNPAIDLLWMDGPIPGNFGDWLSPYIIHSLSNQKVIHIPDYKIYNKKHIVGLGSIANKINKHSHVFGTGIASVSDLIDINAKFHFVRGPATRALIIDRGGPKVDMFGDMGFILSKIYFPKNISKDIDVLFVRHLIHQKLNLDLPQNFVEYSINASDSKTIKDLIKMILRSKKVVTSAMHCFIACKSYGVPCALISFSSSKISMYGDGIKYKDAMLGAGLIYQAPFELPLKSKSFNFDYIFNDEKLNQAFVEDLFNHTHKSLELYNEM
jgi:hypothetical protein